MWQSYIYSRQRVKLGMWRNASHLTNPLETTTLRPKFTLRMGLVAGSSSGGEDRGDSNRVDKGDGDRDRAGSKQI